MKTRIWMRSGGEQVLIFLVTETIEEVKTAMQREPMPTFVRLTGVGGVARQPVYLRLDEILAFEQVE